MSKKSNPVILSVHVRRVTKPATPDQELVIRHQSALRAIDRLDVSRELTPAADYSAPVIQSMAEKAGPIPSYGPRTGTHPMATYHPEPERRVMATRLRPPLEDFGPTDEMIGIAAQCLTIAAAVMIALALAGVVS